MEWSKKIKACWSHDLRRYLPILLAGRPIGYARLDVADVVATLPSAQRTRCGLTLSEATSVSQVTSELDALSRRLRALALIPPLTGEQYGVRHWSRGPVLGCVDRAASLALGVRTAGVHLNVYVRRANKLFMWIARRSWNRRYFPGMLDNLVAGGQPATLSIRENLEREAFEEAGIDRTSLLHATPAGQIAYRFDGPEGLVDSVVYPFDLEVGSAFQPRNSDGGIEAFYLLPIENVVELVRDTDEFKFNCALVIIDFLLRHDVLEPSAITELEEVRSLLYASEPDAPSATREAV